jgi:hypothetical protein
MDHVDKVENKGGIPVMDYPDGKVPITLVFPLALGKWKTKTGIADYQRGRLMSIANVGLLAPPAGDGFSGEIYLCVGTVGARANIVARAYQNGHWVGDPDACSVNAADITP